MQLLKIADLTPHPQNEYYFDDIVGDAWSEFLESIRTSGVIEPVIITQTRLIVSGHQRVRACRELGIEEVMTETRQYDSDDKIIKDLIETNIRQRGIGNPNPVKFGRCITELERIYGIQHGGSRIPKSKNFTLNDEQRTSPQTESELATQLGLTRQSLQNYKKLAKLIPEVEDFLDTGMISANTALAISRQLCGEDQQTLMSQLDKETKYTQREIQNRINEFNRDKKKLTDDLKSLQDQVDKLTSENKELHSSITNNKKVEDDDLSDRYNDLVNRYNDLVSQNKTIRQDNEWLKMSMSDAETSAVNTPKILKALSRISLVINEELLPLLHSDDLAGLTEPLKKKIESSLINNINIFNDCITFLHTDSSPDYVDVID